jgi:hypothetical protein
MDVFLLSSLYNRYITEMNDVYKNGGKQVTNLHHKTK